MWRWLAIMMALLAALPAHAGIWPANTDITCSRSDNVAVIRFGQGAIGPDKFHRLPRRIDGGLSHAAPSRRSDCRLPNGWRLRVRDGEGQGFPYGMGGADPPGFFSLWIDRRRVVAKKTWKPGYGDSGRMLTALVVRPDRLTWCSTDYDAEQPQTCTSRSFRLDRRYRVDRIEYPPNGRKWRTGTVFAIPVAATSGFCNAWLRPMRSRMFESTAFDWALAGDERAPFATDLRGRAKPVAGSNTLMLDTEIARGVPRRLLMIHGADHFFDGDVVMVLPPNTPVAALARRLWFDAPNPDLPPLTERAGWTRLAGGTRALYPGVSPRYVHFVPQRIGGRLYFLASPLNVDKRPTALLIGLRPEGGSRIMCRIRRIEPHF